MAQVALLLHPAVGFSKLVALQAFFIWQLPCPTPLPEKPQRHVHVRSFGPIILHSACFFGAGVSSRSSSSSAVGVFSFAMPLDVLVLLALVTLASSSSSYCEASETRR
jgi:hypothetical protein